MTGMDREAMLRDMSPSQRRCAIPLTQVPLRPLGDRDGKHKRWLSGAGGSG